ESPQVVGNVSWSFLDDTTKNKQRLLSILEQKHKVKIISSNDNVEIFTYSIPMSSVIIGYDKKKMQIIYYVEFSNNENWMIQTKLWRDKNNPLSKNLPYELIFNFALKKFKMVITDVEQSED